MKFQIKLETIQKVKDFVSIISLLEGDYRLVSEPYVVDAKSILGIFSLDLGKPVTLEIVSTLSSAEQVTFKEKIQSFIV